ncbi:hypothetical protein DFP72DRAFT_921538 [Ephemerocybe angulata]|uniref:Uncharacterized protein n=1 Tax=Ephemerocybe angulata TaxID=980116 RepID=A0A8H6LWU7_9AGAR|nr:hypothetical protein DFP72DRAFT_921538 [Tulosesus angulatus]
MRSGEGCVVESFFFLFLFWISACFDILLSFLTDLTSSPPSIYLLAIDLVLPYGFTLFCIPLLCCGCCI